MELFELVVFKIDPASTLGVVQGWSKYPEFPKGQRLFRIFLNFFEESPFSSAQSQKPNRRRTP